MKPINRVKNGHIAHPTGGYKTSYSIRKLRHIRHVEGHDSVALFKPLRGMNLKATGPRRQVWRLAGIYGWFNKQEGGGVRSDHAASSAA
jgi:hypothetical protein